MSTRANIVIKDKGEKLYFYRHSDGYPSGTMPTLEIFSRWIKEGKIRKNISQGSGWLIVLGALEYETVKIPKRVEDTEDPQDWKVGAYEPTTELHGDIQYLYTIDINTGDIDIKKVTYTQNEAGEWLREFVPYSE
jgi:hypothetical protein